MKDSLARLSREWLVAGFVCLAWCSVALAQSPALDEQPLPDPSEMSVAELSEEVSRELTSLREFEAYPPPESAERRKTLEIRRDEKTIALMRNILSLADRVLALQPDAPERDTLKRLLEMRQNIIEQTLVDRFASLTDRLNVSLQEQADLSGPALLSEESYAELLDGHRLRYLSLATQQVLLLEKLEIEDAELRENVVRTLRYFGEEMMGLIRLHHHGLEVFEARQAIDGTDTDLIQAARFEAERLELAVSRLRRVVRQLDQLGANTREMRRILIEERKGLAISLVDGAIMSVLYAEASEKFKEWFKVSGLNAIVSLILFVAIILAARWLGKLTRRLTEHALQNSEESVSQLLRETLISMAGTVVFLIGILVALSQVGVSVTPMIAGLGVVGFIVGFALQDTLSNFASGAMILAYRPFDTGDFISAADVEGEVRKMNLVNTTIVTIDNRVLIIPNSKIWGGVIMNFTGQHLRRTDILYSVSYNEDLDHVQRVLEELIADEERFMKTPEPIVRVKQFSDSSIDFVVRAYTRTTEFWETVWALNKAVKRRFDEEGIKIPYPQRDVHFFPAPDANPESPA